jgi:hypothetical protein
MAQEQVDSIIRALLASQQNAADYQQRQLQQKQLDAQTKAQTEKLKQDQLQAEAAIKEKQYEFDAKQKLDQAVHDMAVFRAKQEVANSGRYTASTTKDATGNNVDEIHYPKELGGGIEFLPALIDVAKRAGEAKLAEKKPEIDYNAQVNRETTQINADRTAEEKRIEEQNKRTENQFAFSRAANLEGIRQQNRLQLEKARAASQRANKLLDPATGGNAVDIETYVKSVADGTFTAKDLADMKIPKTEIDTIMKVAVQHGYVPIKEEQKKDMAALAEIAGVFPDYKKFLDAQPDSSSALGGIYGGINFFDSSQANLAKAIQAKKLQLASFLGGQGKRSTEADAAATIDESLPGNYTPKKVNIDRYNRLRRNIRNAIDAKFANLTPSQKILILDKYNLGDLYGDDAEKPFDAKDAATDVTNRLLKDKGK